MSEVDRLSNSGLYPALPIADRQRNKERGGETPDRQQPASDDGERKQGGPRPPKSLIDEYA